MSDFTLYDLLARSLPYVAAAGDDALAAEIGEALSEHEKMLNIPKCEECKHNDNTFSQYPCWVCNQYNHKFEQK